ncbi:hypothetical protein M9H77_26734 [Catharanthus roseus]|uniref:Uncharacterized protein n=1 Tax=Catharanthus roseus TaxID=4058 RepID=A0ACC0AB01_CATRO|nr:hypothetical protein M9H77_26734 [Catharanthus roseus]
MFLAVRCGGVAIYASPSTDIYPTNSFTSNRDASPFCVLKTVQNTATEKSYLLTYQINTIWNLIPLLYMINKSGHVLDSLNVDIVFIGRGSYAHNIVYACDPVGSLNVAVNEMS